MHYHDRYPNRIPVRTNGPTRPLPTSDLKRQRLHMCQQLMQLGITQESVLQAMATVPRHLFVPDELRRRAYEATALPIGYGQTISKPYTVAMMSQLLEVERGMRVLEIGTGSGYQAAVLATMGCYVFSLERLRELYLKTGALLRQLGFRSIHIQRADGTLGMPQAAPFDRIIVTAGGPEIPRPLVEQLDDDGILLIPVGEQERTQKMVRIRKRFGIVQQETLGNAVFVNLVGSYGWEHR